MAQVTVEFQPTPNPNAGKFVVSRRVVEDERFRSYDTPAEAEGDPLAEALISMAEVTNVFMVEDFVTVTKSPDADWDALIPAVSDAIRTHLG